MASPWTIPGEAKKRDFVDDIDKVAQYKVADVMKKVARTSKPDYIINVGDNFYAGGVTSTCGATNMCTLITTGQWRTLFEQIYDSPELKGKEWHGVLGNHDYGGWAFNMGWDQSVAYTWHSDRWLTPALYWERKVQYSIFPLIITSSTQTTLTPSRQTRPNRTQTFVHETTIGIQTVKKIDGPSNPDHCFSWFWKLWREQLRWLEYRLSKSTAEWQIVVTHFPPQWGAGEWKRLSDQYGIDLIITGHRHQQEFHLNDHHLDLGGTAWVVTGGGGGITSEANPNFISPRVQQYGFLDFEITKHEITVDMWSWKNMLHSSNKVYRRSGRHQVTPAPTPPGYWRVPIPDSCADLGCHAYMATASCQCNSKCTQYNNCCHDVDMCSIFMVANTTSPASRRLAYRSSTCASTRRRGFGSAHRRRALNFQGDCWAPCGAKGGYCSFCGVGNACCRLNSRQDPPECRGVYFPKLEGKGHHTCVEPVSDQTQQVEAVSHEVVLPESEKAKLSKPMPISDLSVEQCFEKCGNQYGPCEYFCGVGRACCMRDGPNQPPECLTAGSTMYLGSGSDECTRVGGGSARRILSLNSTLGSTPNVFLT